MSTVFYQFRGLTKHINDFQVQDNISIKALSKHHNRKFNTPWSPLINSFTYGNYSSYEKESWSKLGLNFDGISLVDETKVIKDALQGLV